MLDINDEVDALRGVGPSLSEKLSSQNIRKIEDLLFFLPIRYEDKTKLIKISDAIIDQKNLTQGKVIDSKILFFGRRVLQVILDDGTEKLKLRFFYFSNNQYKQFTYGKTVVCFGLLKKNGKNLEMIHPEYKILKEEETAFFKTLSAGIKIFEQNIPTKDSEKMSGEIAFKLHDTYGFPIDLTMTMASEKGFEIDQDLFNSLMQVQKEGSKKNSKFDVKDIVINPKLKSKFVGYSDARCEGQCIALFDEDGNEAKSIDKKGFALFSETPFYAESGGQVGDQGSVVGKEFDIRVVDCKKIGDFHLHHIVVEKGNIKLEDQATLFIDEERRKNIVNNHSATHLLHSALRKVLGDSVFQKGSLVTDEKLRFDFSHNKKLSENEISDVENLVNEQIQKSSETVVESMSFDQAIENGALAFFGDKYGDEVRVLKIGGDFSTELCGGTHVTNTSEIEGFIISNETSVSSGVRRIEAMTGSNLIEKSKDALNKLKKLSEMLNVPNEELETRVSDLLKENKKLKSSKKTEKSLSSETLLSESHLVDGKKGEVVVHSNASIEMLRRYADKSVKDAAVSFSILISTDDEKVSYIVTAKQNEKFSAKDLIQLVNTAFNGSGGGRDDFAQGGSQEAGDIENKFNALNINLQSLI